MRKDRARFTFCDAPQTQNGGPPKRSPALFLRCLRYSASAGLLAKEPTEASLASVTTIVAWPDALGNSG